MPCKTDLSEVTAHPPALSCAERHALVECCGEAACFQLDWLDDLHRRPPPDRDALWLIRPHRIDREDH